MATTSLAAAGALPFLRRAGAGDSRRPGCEAGFAQIGQDQAGVDLKIYKNHRVFLREGWSCNFIGG